MDAALGLGDRDPLYAVHAGLVLEPTVRVRSADLERDLLEPAEVGGGGREDLRLPPMAIGEPLIHLEEVARPQRGLLAAGARPDLQDQVLALVGIPGNQQ